MAPYYVAQMKHCTQKWDRRDNQGPGLEVVDTCHQLIGVVGTGLYHSMADVQSMVWFSGIVDVFHHQVSPLQIVASSLGVLLVEDGLVLFEPLCLGVVDILGKGNESRRRRSVGSRHFVWRMGWWCRRQWLTLLLSAHDRHALIWYSLPLPQDSSVCQLDKPQIFSTHFVPTFFGVWIIFIFHLTHPHSIFVTLCHPTHPYLLSPHWIFCNSELALFILYLSPPMSIIGLWSVCKTCPKHVCI